MHTGQKLAGQVWAAPAGNHRADVAGAPVLAPKYPQLSSVVRS